MHGDFMGYTMGSQICVLHYFLGSLVGESREGCAAMLWVSQQPVAVSSECMPC